MILSYDIPNEDDTKYQGITDLQEPTSPTSQGKLI